MYEFAREKKPDVVLIPLRGAHPFSVAYHKIAALNKVAKPDFVLLPLGTCTEGDSVRGLTHPEKKEVVEHYGQSYCIAHPEARKFLLIEEVMQGGTIITHYQLISNFLQHHVAEAELKVCAIEHGRHQQRTRYKNRAAKHGFHQVRVNSLFVMDREQYLPEVHKNGSDFSVNTDERKLEEILEHIEKMH